ncbi:MAG: NAD(P)/FAD-dependent oxidoreductase [Acidobacteria bacterium]|nr:NAD(P)/FAD-dependent oxidoreductase [Acidobacteriota bacterium]
MDSVENVVAGAGVVGLAVARALARAGREVVILEAEDRIGTGVSSRNSEVVHAGIYYPKDSLKARLCVEGNGALYAYCEAKAVAHRRCGKLIVATEGSEVDALKGLQRRAADNGVTLTWLESREALFLEPELRCEAALLSPTTGIVDSHGLMQALLRDAEGEGALLVLKSPVLGGRPVPGGLELEVGGAEPTRIHCHRFFNAAALGAPALARRIEGLGPASVPPLHRSKGNYFSLQGPAPFSRLIYPVPSSDWLGIHLTLDLAGQARFGPDEQWVDQEDYEVDPHRAAAFYPAVRRYWPGLPEGALKPAYAGLRPKLSGPGEAARDFLVQGPEEHGVPGLLNFFGIDSPGLTACLALATHGIKNVKTT